MTAFKVGDRVTQAQEASQDDETKRFQMLAALRLPLLLRRGWKLRYEGLDGLGCLDHPSGRRIIHSIAREPDGEVWAHVSASDRSGVMPSWERTRDTWWLIYPDSFGIVVVAPKAAHVNIAEVSHVWGCLTRPTVPDFTQGTASI